MGNSARSAIIFGVIITDAPWFDYNNDLDSETWWQKIKGYKPLENVFNDDGEYADPKPSQEQISAYFAHKDKWEKENPFPYIFERSGSCDDGDELNVLCFENIGIGGDWERPEPFSLSQLKPPEQNKIDEFIRFCKEYEIEFEVEPQWYLVSYYG